MRLLIVLFLLGLGSAAAAADAERGRTLFVKHGCYECHGFAGQGGMNGKKLAPNPLALEAMSAFVRNTNGAMPPFSKAILPEADLADIHAYLASIPPTKDYRGIPLLNP